MILAPQASLDGARRRDLGNVVDAEGLTAAGPVRAAEAGKPLQRLHRYNKVSPGFCFGNCSALAHKSPPSAAG